MVVSAARIQNKKATWVFVCW